MPSTFDSLSALWRDDGGHRSLPHFGGGPMLKCNNQILRKGLQYEKWALQS